MFFLCILGGIRYFVIIMSIVLSERIREAHFAFSYLDAIGDILYKAHIPALADVVVLDPCWLTASILGPLMSPTIDTLKSMFETCVTRPASDGSILMSSLVQVIAKQAKLKENIAVQIVELMFGMGLCVSRDRDTLVIPSLATVHPFDDIGGHILPHYRSAANPATHGQLMQATSLGPFLAADMPARRRHICSHWDFFLVYKLRQVQFRTNPTLQIHGIKDATPIVWRHGIYIRTTWGRNAVRCRTTCT
jgi:hypothetical protein